MSRLEVITGPMFCGKSEELIRRIRRAEYAKQDILIFKPAIDNRPSGPIIAARGKDPQDSDFKTQVFLPAINIANQMEARRAFETDITWSVLAIDEAQFFEPWLYDFIVNILEETSTASEPLIIYVAGLDMDAWRKPFGVMPQLMAIADSVHKHTAVCFKCGANAIFTQKLSKSKKKIDVGDNDKYEARCRACHTIPE